MRYAYIILLVFFASLSWARMNVGIVGGGSGASVISDSCTGGLLFSWHMETTNVTTGGVAGGVNNGCAAGSGDTTATLTNQADINNAVTPYDGSYSMDVPGDYDYYSFDISSDDIINDAAGTIIFYIYIQTFVDGARIFHIDKDNNNQVVIEMNLSGNNKLRILYTGNGTTYTAQTTNSSSIPEDEWVKVTAKWSTAGVSGNYLYIDFNDANSGTGTSALVGLATTPDIMHIGNNQNDLSDYALDNLKIYDSWL